MIKYKTHYHTILVTPMLIGRILLQRSRLILCRETGVESI